MDKDKAPVTVICGANTQVLEDVVGMTVGEIRRKLADVLNIPTPSQAIIGGSSVDDNYAVQPNDRLEFVKPAGTKG